ncbi:hypothetical protein Leryth_006127 [Lithospermum erythrorhizon]|nr:hypothetical protein Leryth_006127 [Lithospermum erythrorhizon]
MADTNDIEAPQITSFVIITLPPSDNPSFGKTITAFTISDEAQPIQSQAPPQSIQETNQELNQQQTSQFFNSSLNRFVSRSPVLISGLVGISVVALFFYMSALQETLFELRDIDDDHNSNSFIFPLYPKVQNDVEFKFGKILDSNYSGIMKTEKISKLTSFRSEVESSAIFPIKGNVYPNGLYYTVMLVGNPPKPYFLDMDTGSDLTWIQCDAPCTSCAKGPHPPYKPSKNYLIPSDDSYCIGLQRNQRNKHCVSCDQCDYEIEYADHSFSAGVLAGDTLHLINSDGSLSKSDIVFGCGYDQQGILLNSLQKTDGIIGLGKSEISLPSQLASQHIIKNVVGHCLPREASDNGYLFLGDDFVPHRQMAMVPMLSSPSMGSYQTELMKISYNGRHLNLNAAYNGPISLVFDSGSSYTYFTEEAYNELVVAVNKDAYNEGLVRDASDDTLPVCWKAEFPVRHLADVSKSFKPLNLQLGSKWWIISTNLRIPPEGYLIINNRGNVCLGVLNGSEVLGKSTMIVGDISMRGQMFVYDNENKRIGWIKSECTRPRRFDKFPVW